MPNETKAEKAAAKSAENPVENRDEGSDGGADALADAHLRTAEANHILAEMRHDPAVIERIFRDGVYPYKRKISRKVYEAHKAELQAELLKVQNWVKETGQ